MVEALLGALMNAIRGNKVLFDVLDANSTVTVFFNSRKAIVYGPEVGERGILVMSCMSIWRNGMGGLCS